VTSAAVKGITGVSHDKQVIENERKI